MFHCPAGIKKLLFATLNLFEIIHKIYYMQNVLFPVCLQPDLLTNKCVLQPMPEVRLIYKKLIFLPFNRVPKEP